MRIRSTCSDDAHSGIAAAIGASICGNEKYPYFSHDGAFAQGMRRQPDRGFAYRIGTVGSQGSRPACECLGEPDVFIALVRFCRDWRPDRNGLRQPHLAAVFYLLMGADGMAGTRCGPYAGFFVIGTDYAGFSWLPGVAMSGRSSRMLK